MPLMDEDESTSPPLDKAAPPVRIENPDARTVVVDSELHPPTTLATSIEGSSWIVTYFSQVINTDNQLSTQALTKAGVYQQYTSIKGMELKVTTPLTQSQDPTQKNMVVTGAANVYPFLIPNEGDMFVADIGDGRAGVFTVTNSERKSILKETAYAIEYTLVDYATEERLADLGSKTIKTVNFVKEFSLYGQNPFVMDSDLHAITTLADHYHYLVDFYFTMFSSNEFRTILVPGQDHPTYDHFLMKALTKVVSPSDNYKIRSNSVLNCDGDELMTSMSVWDMLIKRDARVLRYSWSRAGVIPAKAFDRNPQLNGIRFSGIRNVVYPINPFVSVDHKYKRQITPLSYRSAETNAMEEIDNVEEALVDTMKSLSAAFDIFDKLAAGEDISGENETILPITDDVEDVPNHVGSVGAVLSDDYYVFSQKFYSGSTEGLTDLELLVRKYLQKEELNATKLVALCNECQGWGSMEKFYYIPVLLILIKGTIRSY